MDSKVSLNTHSGSAPIISNRVNVYDEPQRRVLPLDFYVNFLSKAARERNPSPIRSLLPLEATPGLISLLAGQPNPATFPFTSLDFTVRSPFNLSERVKHTLEGDDLAEGLQYAHTTGIPRLIEWVFMLQEKSHGRKKGEGWRVTTGSGSQDLIYKAVVALVNDGDSVLVESPVYAGTIPMFQSLHCEQIEVETDSNGICSASLRHILETWPQNKSKPRVLYTVPYGCNPTGMTATLDRRKEVLALAREHNFIILEDDPYYYLYYGDAPRYPSYFELDAKEPEVGRVLRFDSLSKIFSAGMRIGFASGPIPLIDAMDIHSATANLQACSLSQAISFRLLDSWGYEGVIVHTKAVSRFYRERRDVFESAMRRHLEGLAEWSTPEAGMFFWFKLILSNSDKDQGDSERVIRTKALERGVLALPGTVFLPNGRKTTYVRASFSLIREADIDEAIKRLRETVLDARIN